MTSQGWTPTALLAAVLLAPLGCGDEPVTPVTFAQACDRANHQKNVEVAGYILAGRSVVCDTSDGRKYCGLVLTEQPGTEPGVSLRIAVGSGKNAMAKPERNYTRDTIKLLGDDGKPVSWRDKSKVIAKVFAVPDSLKPADTVCFLFANKIAR